MDSSLYIYDSRNPLFRAAKSCTDKRHRRFTPDDGIFKLSHIPDSGHYSRYGIPQHHHTVNDINITPAVHVHSSTYSQYSVPLTNPCSASNLGLGYTHPVLNSSHKFVM
jgi:hypothetical protein